MKQLTSLFFFILIACCAHAQADFLQKKAWKVAESKMVFQQKQIVHFHKDSQLNETDYTRLLFRFYPDNSYVASNTPDTATIRGTWRISATADSVMIDSVSYSLLKLSNDSFITRGYALPSSATGKTDTVYNYLKLYAVSADAGSLPVTLAAFSGKLVTNSVQLSWQTMTEENNQRFEIEAGYTETAFEKIGEVQGKMASNSLTAYLFTDQHFFRKGKNYYRLKQVDVDGNYTFSKVIMIYVNESQKDFITLFPNPVKTEFTVSMSRPAGSRFNLIVTDIAGREVWRKTYTSTGSATRIRLPKRQSGMYLISVMDSDNKKLLTEKLLIE